MGYSPFPATSDIICQYAAFLARTLKVSSIRNYLHIIGLLHKELGLKNPLAGNWVLDTLIKGMKRAKGDAVKQKFPITVDLLFSIWHLLNFRSSFDSAFWAICLTAFFGMFRKSHLLVTTAGKFNPLQQFIRSDFSFYPWGVLISVRWSKTIQFRERTISIPLPAIPNSILCPVVAIRHAFSMADSCTDSGQAFCWLDKSTLRLRSFTYRYFLDKLRRCLGSLGLPAELYATHSFRRGGASFAFQAGVPIEMIKLLGDWKSNAVLMYLTVPVNLRINSANQIAKHILQYRFHAP